MAIVMAGGQGSRLKPLTDKRSKPAVPFGYRYRVVDFVLSNLVNSGCLVRAMHEAHKRGETRFGRHVLPRMLETHRVFAYHHLVPLDSGF